MIDIVSSFLNIKKKVNINYLPSQGLFYNDDFKFYIKRASEKNINFYKKNIEIKSISNVIFFIKKIVSENIVFSKDYKFDDLKSIDIIFIFIEIVKFTTNKKILIEVGDGKKVEFTRYNFNYFFNDQNVILKLYDENEKCFLIDGYKFTLPSIGVENSLTNFLIKKIDIEKDKKYGDYFYDFTYFLGKKNCLNENEIENLIEIFNFEVDKNENKKIKNIIEKFIPIQTYQLIEDNKVIEITSKINLKTIWD